MNCANHTDVAAVAYCRNCGKPLCSQCTRDVQGVIYCETCVAQKMHGAPGMGSSIPNFAPGVVPPVASSGPNAALAGVLAGMFPFGVGAVYTGQYAKGLAHLVIFTGLVWGETVIHSGGLNAVMGLGIAFFYVYQIIDAVKSAWAIRLGQPVPDPFGLARMFGSDFSSRMGAAYPAAGTAGYAATAGYVAPTMGYAAAPVEVEAQPAPSKIPTAAVVLIGLGALFLLDNVGIFNFSLDHIWPLFLVALGLWMFAVRTDMIPGRAPRPGRGFRRRGMIAPAVLVTVGFLSLIDSFHGPDWGRTWPVLLLVIGAVKLWESQQPAAAPYSVPVQPPTASNAVVSQDLPAIYTPPVPPTTPGSGEINNG